MNRRKLIRHIQNHGCVFDRQGGNHEIWLNPANGRIAAIPRHRTVKRTTARSVCIKLDIPLPDGF